MTLNQVIYNIVLKHHWVKCSTMVHNKKSNSIKQWNQKIWLNAETKLIMLLKVNETF